jgi:DNA-binding response OmpR family regulator
MRVLIADADPALLEILQSFLRGRGHEVEMAGDGLECLSTLRRFAPDVLVLDRDLLWGGGDGVMAHMREDPSLADVPVIVLADQDISDKPGGLRAGWLRKPYRFSDLLGRIKSFGCSAPFLNPARPDLFRHAGRFDAFPAIPALHEGNPTMHRSLLIVEDDLNQLATLKCWFVRAGYQVTGVTHPRQALEAASFRPFQVAIINHTLPEIDGIELMRRLQRLLGDIQIVIQSYHPQAVSDAKAAGAFACLVKPCRMALLEATVEDAYERSTVELPVLAEQKVPAAM